MNTIGSKCDVVVVNWNAGLYLRKCIESLLEGDYNEIIQHIYIIDNSSSDNSLTLLPDNEKIVIIRNDQNKGFGVACNQGIALSTAPFVVMVNPDVVLFKTTIVESMAYMENNEKIDILGAMQLDEHSKIRASCARFPTPLRFLNDALGLSKMLPGIFKPATLMTDWSHTESREVDQIIGSFMFIRRRVFDSIGVFDPLFFVYYEELDLSKRLKNFGGISYYNHNIKLLHYGEGTTKDVKSYRLYLNLKSRLLYARKHFPKRGFYFTFFSTMVIEPISRIVFLLFQGRLVDIRAIFRGFRLLWKEWRAILG